MDSYFTLSHSKRSKLYVGEYKNCFFLLSYLYVPCMYCSCISISVQVLWLYECTYICTYACIYIMLMSCVIIIPWLGYYCALWLCFINPAYSCDSVVLISKFKFGFGFSILPKLLLDFGIFLVRIPKALFLDFSFIFKTTLSCDVIHVKPGWGAHYTQ